MSQVLTSFLVGMGLDTTDFNKGQRDVNAGADAMKGKMLLMGAAITGALLGVGKGVASTSDELFQLQQTIHNFKTSPETMYAISKSVEMLGGSAEGAIESVKGMEAALNTLKIQGEAGEYGGALQLAGIDVKPLMLAQSGADIMKELSKQIPNLDIAHRQQLQSVLHVDPGMMKLLEKGETGYTQTLEHVTQVTGMNPELLKKSLEFQKQTAETALLWAGMWNGLTDKFLPALTQGVEILNYSVKVLLADAKVGIYATRNGEVYFTDYGRNEAEAKEHPDMPPIQEGEEWNLGKKALSYDMMNARLVNGSPIIPGMEPVKPGEEWATTKSKLASDWAWLTDLFTPDEVGQPSYLNTPPVVNYDYSNGFAPPQLSNTTHSNQSQVSVKLKPSDTPIQNNITVQLDGRALEAKIIDVQDKAAQTTIESMKSTTER